MDLDEHALSEGQRTLKRLGITHVWARGTASCATPVPPASARLDQKSGEINAYPNDSSLLPAQLRNLFHGKQSPVRTLWTYSGMHEDLLQNDIPERLAFFRTIQDTVCSHLAWRHGDISSWPLDLDPHLWDQGIARLRPQIIICFGDASRMTREKSSNLQVHVLPDILEMARGNKALKNIAWKILQTLT